MIKVEIIKDFQDAVTDKVHIKGEIVEFSESRYSDILATSKKLKVDLVRLLDEEVKEVKTETEEVEEVEVKKPRRSSSKKNVDETVAD